MTLARKLLMETLVGHFALLELSRPDKASSPLAQRTRRYVKSTLRKCEVHGKRQAA
jgi:hypothetical protein